MFQLASFRGDSFDDVINEANFFLKQNDHKIGSLGSTTHTTIYHEKENRTYHYITIQYLLK